MKKYLFYLEPYAHIFKSKNVVVIYNSLSRYGWKTIIVNSKVKKIISQLMDLKNMYCIELEASDLSDIPVSEFISKIRESFSGDLIEKPISNSKPAIMVPEMRLQDDVRRTYNDEFRSLGNDIKTYLNEISFYIIGNNSSSSLLKFEMYKQFEYSFHQVNLQLQLSSIRSVLNQIQHDSVGRINILGGNIFQYEELDRLTAELKQMHATKYYFIHYKDLPGDNQKLQIFQDKSFTLKILVDSPIQSSEFEKVLQMRTEPLNIEWLFAITSKGEFTEVELLIEKYHISDTEIAPVYTGNNLNFFINNVFLSEDEILNSNLCRQEILMNQTLNIYNFGKLTYLPNGEVYANVNCSCLGTINDSVKEIIYNEIIRKTAWFKIRDQKPCSKCVYQFLCPSPSNYEFVIGKSNLCEVN